MLQVETKLNSLEMEVDKSFLQSVGLPGLEIYDSQDSPRDEPEPNEPHDAADDLAANQQMVLCWQADGEDLETVLAKEVQNWIAFVHRKTSDLKVKKKTKSTCASMNMET